MRIALFSDIHLEHRPYTKEWQEIMHRIADTSQLADLVVNAGDTHHSYDVRKSVRDFFEKDRKQQYLDVMGNHDWYGHNWEPDDFHTTQFGDLKVVHGTMWTNFNGWSGAAREAEQWISDFHCIYDVTADKMVSEFEMFEDYVELMKPDVVVSHFGPHPGSIVEQWKGHALNPYFCPNMIDRLKHKPKLWLHGHIHNPVDYGTNQGGEGSVRVVANPLGYPRETYRDISEYSCKIVEV